MLTGRRSFWRIYLEQARKSGEWVEIPRYYTRTTAAQIVCDIRGGRRVAGIEADETWLAEWEGSDDPTQDHLCRIHIRYAGCHAGS